MNRRDLITAAGAATAAILAAPAMAAEHDHHHGAMAAPANAKIIASALDCVKTGDACLAHCFDSFAMGDTSLAVCAKKVDELIAVCAALAKLASNNSAQLVAYAKAAAQVCQACEKECRKHADKHATCKACADACVACAEECAKL
jgi:Cys-rich four helix bundle protein (predicted Tat secretion target)